MIELLIAMAIGVVIAAAMAGLYTQSLKTREQVDRTSQRIENGRYGLDAMAEDVRLAGYFGDLSPASDTTWNTGDPCVTTLANLKTQWSATTPTLPVAIMGYEGGHSAAVTFTAPTCLSNRKAGTDIVAIRRVSTTAIDATSAAVTAAGGGAFIQVSSQTPFCTTSESSFLLADSATDMTLHQTNCTSAAKARALVVRLYYIATCNICSGSDTDTTPTLKVAELSGGSFSIRSVALGVDDLHVEYGVDSVDSDGATNEYLVSTNDGKLGTRDWVDVVSARIYLLVRDQADTPSYTNSSTYTMGTKTASAFNDARKRNVVTTTARLSNVAGRRELP